MARRDFKNGLKFSQVVCTSVEQTLAKFKMFRIGAIVHRPGQRASGKNEREKDYREMKKDSVTKRKQASDESDLCISLHK